MSLWPLSIVTAAATATDSARELNARMSVLCKAKRHAEALALSVEAERHGARRAGATGVLRNGHPGRAPQLVHLLGAVRGARSLRHGRAGHSPLPPGEARTHARAQRGRLQRHSQGGGARGPHRERLPNRRRDGVERTRRTRRGHLRHADGHLR
eukprot:ctg_3363.g424